MNCVSAPGSEKIFPKKEFIISEGSLENIMGIYADYVSLVTW